GRGTEKDPGGHMFRARGCLAIVIAAIGAAAPAGPAAAATVRVIGDVVEYEAASGEANELSINQVGTELRFTDHGAPISGCPAGGPHTVVCTVPVLRQIVVRLGDMDDTAWS